GAAGSVAGNSLRQVAPRLERQQVLLLRGQKLGTVEAEQRLAFADPLAGRVDVQHLDPPFHLGVDMVVARLVGGDPPHGPEGADDAGSLHLRGSYADELALAKRNLDGSESAHATLARF